MPLKMMRRGPPRPEPGTRRRAMPTMRLMIPPAWCFVPYMRSEPPIATRARIERTATCPIQSRNSCLGPGRRNVRSTRSAPRSPNSRARRARRRRSDIGAGVGLSLFQYFAEIIDGLPFLQAGESEDAPRIAAKVGRATNHPHRPERLTESDALRDLHAFLVRGGERERARPVGGGEHGGEEGLRLRRPPGVADERTD